jgi:hypothetical protein
LMIIAKTDPLNAVTPMYSIPRAVLVPLVGSVDPISLM